MLGGERMKHRRLRYKSSGAEMSFTEIAEKLGTTRQNVHSAYLSGLRKLRVMRPLAISQLSQLADELGRERDAREGVSL